MEGNAERDHGASPVMVIAKVVREIIAYQILIGGEKEK